MKKREVRDYIYDIKEAISDCAAFIEGIDFQAFESDKKTINAVVRSIEIIGEASKNIPNEIRQKNANIPWTKMAGMRDKLIHQYFGIDNQILWKTVTEDIPNLSKHLTNIEIE